MTESVILVVLILLIGVPVLGYLVSNNLLKPPIQGPATRIWKSIKFVFYLLLGVGIAFAVFEKMADSGWVPRTREVPVYVNAQNWATGEIKACVSFAKDQGKELEILVCGRTTDERHVMNVKLWGSLTGQKERNRKCTRETESLTCRLQ